MPRERETREDFFLLRATANVMNGQEGAVGGFAIGKDENVRKIAGDQTSHDVTRLKSFWRLGKREFIATAFEESLQIQHAPVIDIRVRFGEPPAFGINGKVGSHIFVHLLLQIDPQPAQSPDNNIRANARFFRHIATGIGERAVSRIVAKRNAHLFARLFDKRRGLDIPVGQSSDGEKTRSDQREEEFHSKAMLIANY